VRLEIRVSGDSEEMLAERVESILRREGRPMGLREIRRHLGSSASAEGLSSLLRGVDRFFRVGSKWYVRGAPLKVKVRFCPNCGYAKVTFRGGFYLCPNCGTKFHFTWLA